MAMAGNSQIGGGVSWITKGPGMILHRTVLEIENRKIWWVSHCENG